MIDMNKIISDTEDSLRLALESLLMYSSNKDERQLQLLKHYIKLSNSYTDIMIAIEKMG